MYILQQTENVVHHGIIKEMQKLRDKARLAHLASCILDYQWSKEVIT